MSMHVIRVRAADAADVTVISNTSEVVDHARRHVHPWWTSSRLLPESDCDGPVVIADIDPETVSGLARRVAEGRQSSGDVPTVVDREHGLAYRYEAEPGTLTIYGCRVESLARAAAAYLRESMRAALLRAGWSFLRASAVVRNGQAALLCGDASTGKTGAALTLAARRGWALLGNDRVFVRPDAGGDVQVLPWPAPVAVGLGLLSGLGWSGPVRTRLRAGQAPHPAQDPRATAALLAGQSEAVLGGDELKPLFSPHRLHDWLDVPMTTVARARAVVFPRYRPGAEPATTGDARPLGPQDFPGAHACDPRPGEFTLALGDDPAVRAASLDLLAALPRMSVTLGPDAESNAGFLHREIRAAFARCGGSLPATA